MPIEPVGKSGEPKDPYTIRSTHHAHHSPPSSQRLGSASSGASIQGEECYIDMGEFYGHNISSCMDWSTTPPHIKASSLQQGFLGNLFTQLKSAGVNQINLSFAQIADINNLLLDSQGHGPTPPYSSNDSFGQIFHPDGTTSPYAICDDSGSQVSSNFLSYLTNYAHDQNPPIQVSLSMGGLNANLQDLTPQKGAATDLASFMKNTGIDSVDFDMENQGLDETTIDNKLMPFFSDLHTQLASMSKTSTLTLTGGAMNSSSPLYPLLNNFTKNFDGLNLMLYSDSVYYLNTASNNVWPGIENAIKTIGGDASKLHIGFFPNVAYENPSANGDGASYKINPGSSRGQAAAQMYQQLCQQLQTDGYLKPGQSLGEPFFWVQTPGDPASSQVMQDFYNTLKGISKTPWG